MVDRNLKKKYLFLQWLTIVLFAVLAFRLVTLQLVEAAVYQTKADQNQFRFLTIHAPRGDIVDKNGKPLAANKIVNTVSIVRQQADAETLDKTIKNLAALLGDIYPEIDAKYIKKLMDDHSGRSYEPVIIKRDIPIEVVARLEERRRDFPGVVIGKEMVRYYPEATLASHLLGHIGEISEEELKKQGDVYKQGDLVGRFGLEAQYEQYLRGKNGFNQVEVDVNGRPIPNKNLIKVDPEQGNNLVLTIDYDLQKTLEESMDKSLADLKKSAGSAVVFDARTGAILAMVSRPGFDPNDLVPPDSTTAVQEYLNPGTGKKSVMQNRAISAKYPPGSTFKPVTAVAALDSGKMTPSDTVNCRGYVPYYPTTKCTASHGAVNLSRAMAVSCNIYFIEAGRRAGIDILSKYIHELGLDEKTGVDLPGEIAGNTSNPEKKKADNLPWLDKKYKEKQDEIEKKYDRLLKDAKGDQEKRDLLFNKKDEQRVLKSWYQIQYNEYVKWLPRDTYFMAFGQGANEFTPIGLANYAATIANGGKLMRPYLVERVESPDGKVIAEFGPHQIRKTDISEKTLAQVREAMTKVCEPGGTGYSLFKDFPFKVAAKTGTAQSGWQKDSQGREIYHGVFITFAPADNPEIVFAGIIEEGYHGSTSAGPISREVFKEYFGLNKEIKKQAPKTAVPNTSRPQTAASNTKKPSSETQSSKPTPSAEPPKPQTGDNGGTEEATPDDGGGPPPEETGPTD